MIFFRQVAVRVWFMLFFPIPSIQFAASIQVDLIWYTFIYGLKQLFIM